MASITTFRPISPHDVRVGSAVLVKKPIAKKISAVSSSGRFDESTYRHGTTRWLRRSAGTIPLAHPAVTRPSPEMPLDAHAHARASSARHTGSTRSRVLRARLQAPGGCPVDCRKCLHRCAWSVNPHFSAMSLKEASDCSMYWAASSTRRRITNAWGVSPKLRLKEREKCASLRWMRALRSATSTELVI